MILNLDEMGMKYQFLEQHKMDALPNGKVRCYYNEEVRKETITNDEAEDTHDVYVYDAVDVDAPVTKGALVDAIIRTRYSQADVEAIMRHMFAGVNGSEEEFREFNVFAEVCKENAMKTLE